MPFFGQFMSLCTLNEHFIHELLLKNEMSDQKKCNENTKKLIIFFRLFVIPSIFKYRVSYLRVCKMNLF